MKDERVLTLTKSLVWGLIWLIIASIVGFILTKFMTSRSFQDILFIEGLVLIFAGIFASISGDPRGVSMQGLGQNNAQYINNANLEVARMEKEKVHIKTDIKFALSTFSLVIGGILSVALTFII
ncbi:hypothetical protein [Clostridium nigeriense]|uniref:hypothetical protein n=1 Tax=Clostridium nigeriense TaxID=1805470 RepID=UPI0008341E1B|nr:hypothetical protein [Clostridium nigeriense]